MPAKRALIVDDSRSARLVLSRVLEQHGLAVDNCASAEEALEYLARSRPDVIFMDHLMPGMDGLQAVRVIKNNPATATIPIMMYTSQEGELYVSQARALGAIGVLPKQVKPVAVSGVLRSLNLLPPGAAAAATPGPAPGAAEKRPGVTLTDLKAAIRDTLDERLALLHRELADLQARIEDRRGGRLRRWLALPVGAAVAAIGIVAWFSAAERPHDPTPRVAAAPISRPASAAPPQEVAVPPLLDAAVIETLEWGLNLAGHYEFGELPLGDRRLALVQGLVTRLERLGFRGAVELDVHAGEFCLSGSAEGGYRPARSDLAVGMCDAIGYGSAASGSAAELQSIAFANYLTTLGVAGADGVRIDIVPLGAAVPRVPYPELAAGLTAGEWNRAARANQRVEISLRPAAD